MNDAETTYNTAIALNNMAITMMERSCHVQAFETLRDAILVFSSISRLEARNAMLQAQYRIASPLFSAAVPIQVFSHEAIKRVKSDDSHLRVYSVFRVDTAEDATFLDHQHENPKDLPSCIILYNLAVSFLCCHHSTCSGSSNSNGLDIAIQLLRFSLKNLQQLYHASVSGENLFLTRQIVLFTCHVLQTLVATLAQAGQKGDAASFHETLSLICNEAHDLDRTGLFSLSIKSAAPAA
jgi:hypothetical protein